MNNSTRVPRLLHLRAAKRASGGGGGELATRQQRPQKSWLPPWPLVALTALVGVASGFYIFQPLLSRAAAHHT
jgi:hypothetical protein